MEKTEKMLEAIEHPERFSESELRALLEDPECREVYQLMCLSRSAGCVRQGAIQADDDEAVRGQWATFRASCKRKKLVGLLAKRKAAAVIGFLILSCSIIVGVSISNDQLQSEKGSGMQENEATASLVEETARQIRTAKDTVILFEEEPLERILEVLAPYYDVSVELKSSETKKVKLFLKWDSTMRLPELIDHLNSFERINLRFEGTTITDK